MSRRMGSKCAVVAVTNDLTTDQRADRTCRTLRKAGYDVVLAGRRMRNSRTLGPRSYSMHRMRLLFEKGPLFYAEYNLALLAYLLTRKTDLIVTNDTDTLPAGYLAYRLKRLFAGDRVSHLHDCHEYFTGMPELTNRNRVTAIWRLFERIIFPRLPFVAAVNGSVARLYSEEYGCPVTVLRNVPDRKQGTAVIAKTALGIGPGQKVILYQGAVNVSRGLEEAVEAMKYLKTDAVLLIAGTGDVIRSIEEQVRVSQLGTKVRLLGQIPLGELHAYTLLADLGLSVEKDVSLNYRIALPNKFLDYIQAGVPVLVSPFPEMKAIVDRYEIGEYLESHAPEAFAGQMDRILGDGERLARYRENLRQAAEDLCWEKEEEHLLSLLERMEQPPDRVEIQGPHG